MEKPKRNHCDSWNLKLFSCDCHNKVAETLELKQQKFIISALEAGHPRSRRQEGWTLLPAVLLARRGHLRHVPSRRLCCFLFLKGQKSEQLRAQPVSPQPQVRGLCRDAPRTTPSYKCQRLHALQSGLPSSGLTWLSETLSPGELPDSRKAVCLLVSLAPGPLPRWPPLPQEGR